MSEKVLNGSVRETRRKGPARRLRSDGKLPGVVYGLGENLPVTVASKDILKILEAKGGSNNILLTKFEGDAKERRVMIKELDVHPMNDMLMHIDLMEIDINKPIAIAVELEFTGVSIGVKDKGGRLNTSLDKLKIECMPQDIPASIVVPLDDLDIGDIWRVKDIKIDSKLTVLDDPKSQVVSVSIPKVVEEAEAPAAGEGEAPEGAEASGDDKKEEGKPAG